MARKRSKKRSMATLIFVLIVAQIGIGLVATGHMRNPFNVLKEIATLRLDFSSAGNRPTTFATQPARTPGVRVPEGGFRDIRWSEFRHVLFDWWFIAAVTALVIVIGRPIGFLFKRLRMVLKPPSRTAPVEP